MVLTCSGAYCLHCVSVCRICMVFVSLIIERVLSVLVEFNDAVVLETSKFLFFFFIFV